MACAALSGCAAPVGVRIGGPPCHSHALSSPWQLLGLLRCFALAAPRGARSSAAVSRARGEGGRIGCCDAGLGCGAAAPSCQHTDLQLLRAAHSRPEVALTPPLELGRRPAIDPEFFGLKSFVDAPKKSKRNVIVFEPLFCVARRNGAFRCAHHHPGIILCCAIHRCQGGFEAHSGSSGMAGDQKLSAVWPA